MHEGDNDDSFVRPEHKENEIGFCKKLCNCGYLWRKYDSTFVMVYGIQYACAAFKFPVLMAI